MGTPGGSTHHFLSKTCGAQGMEEDALGALGALSDGPWALGGNGASGKGLGVQSRRTWLQASVGP